MFELDAYLAKHFMNADQFAAACRLSRDELTDLIQERLIPEPSYVVSQSSIVTSHLFGKMSVGQMPVSVATNGEYFHPANKAWVKIAQQITSEFGRSQAHTELKKRFCGNMQSVLANLNATIWRLHDSFAEDGAVHSESLRIRIESMWTHFLYGTFGLCVANPISEAAIALKLILQEKLIALSNNGSMTIFSDTEARNLLELIDAYSNSAMPFSPIEYPVSSRKRLIDDLSARIRTACPMAYADETH